MKLRLPTVEETDHINYRVPRSVKVELDQLAQQCKRQSSTSRLRLPRPARDGKGNPRENSRSRRVNVESRLVPIWRQKHQRTERASETDSTVETTDRRVHLHP